MDEQRRTAVVDFDGTLSVYDKWLGEEVMGPPISLAREALCELKEWGWRIVVYTTRGRVDLVEAWLREHQIPFNSVNTNDHNPPNTSSKPIATVYFDDRDAHCVGSVYDWVRAMRRVRRLYQPDKNLHIDDAACWAGWPARLSRWISRRWFYQYDSQGWPP